MKTFKNLVLTEDTIFGESIKVEGNITGYYNLTVRGNINAWNIDALDINAWNIDALNINALDIDARNIDALDIKARDIDALDIKARDIDARDIDALDINAWNIDALDIDARNIDAWDIIYCENVKSKLKIRAKVLIKGRSKLKQKEWK